MNRHCLLTPIVSLLFGSLFAGLCSTAAIANRTYVYEGICTDFQVGVPYTVIIDVPCSSLADPSAHATFVVADNYVHGSDPYDVRVISFLYSDRGGVNLEYVCSPDPINPPPCYWTATPNGDPWFFGADGSGWSFSGDPLTDGLFVRNCCGGDGLVDLL